MIYSIFLSIYITFEGLFRYAITVCSAKFEEQNKLTMLCSTILYSTVVIKKNEI
jgi:hypothetical protein